MKKLTSEEKGKILEEEKARFEAREKIQAEEDKKKAKKLKKLSPKLFLGIIAFLVLCYLLGNWMCPDPISFLTT